MHDDTMQCVMQPARPITEPQDHSTTQTAAIVADRCIVALPELSMGDDSWARAPLEKFRRREREREGVAWISILNDSHHSRDELTLHRC